MHVVVIGGSISAGTGCPSMPYPLRFFAWLNATFPHRGNRLRNSAMGATGTPLYAFCTAFFVPQASMCIALMEVEEGTRLAHRCTELHMCAASFKP